MHYYALVFMLVGLIPSALNLAGVSPVTIQISALIVVLAAIHVLKRSTARVP